MNDADKTREQLLAELQRLQAQQTALQKVRTEVWRMRDEKDIRQVLEAIKDSLNAMGIAFSSLGINVVSRAKSPPTVRYHVYIEHGAEPRWDIYEHEQDDGAILDVHDQRAPVYRPDLDAEDHYGEKTILENAFGYPVRSVIDIPFANGTLALNSAESDPYSARDIQSLEALAEVLSESFRRSRDLQTLAERNRALEQEISERRQAEDRLRDSERRLHHMTESLGEGLLVTDENDEISYANSRMAEMTGYTVEEMIGQPAHKLLLPESEWAQLLERNVERATGRSDQYELLIRRRDGSSFWALITASPFRDDRGEIVGTVGAHIDITERKRIEEQLSRQTDELAWTNTALEEQSRLLEAYQQIGEMTLSSLQLDQVLDTLGEQILRAGIFRSLMVALVDEEENEVEVVRCFTTQLAARNEFTPGKVRSTGERVGMRYGLDDGNITAQVAREGQLVVIDGWDGRFDPAIEPTNEDMTKVSYFIPVRREDRVLAVLATASRPEDKEQTLAHIEVMQPLLNVAAIALEHAHLYRELGESEAQLRQAQKMEAVGELTAGIAHNFNNILVGVIGNVQLAMQDAPDRLQTLLAGADRSAQQAADMVAQLMAYSRQTFKAPYQPLALNDLVEDVVSICRRTFDRKIDLALYAPQGLPAVLGDTAQLNQVFMNLLLNARDALEDVDRATPLIRLDIDALEIEPDGLEPSSDVRPGSFVRVRVVDNGAGMDEETQRRVFDPFFTTKAVDKGTGLGLSTVYGIALQHGGWVECDSLLGERTTFAVYLPATEQVIEQKSQPQSGALPRGDETILVIDDEEEVRMVLERALDRCGYRTIMATNGPEGLALYEAHEEIALVVLDLSMPKMSGEEVLARLRAHDPQPKVVVLSGYSVSSGQFAGQAEVLKKPISVKDLAQKVRSVLDA